MTTTLAPTTVVETTTTSSAPVAETSTTAGSSESSAASTSTAVTSTLAPTTAAETTTTSPPFSGVLVPPADPSSLIGATISTRQIVSPGRPPVGDDPPLLINGAATNLVSFGGGCVGNDCERALELLADAATIADGSWPSASYLVFETLLDHDPDGMPIWTIADIVAITDAPPDGPVTILAEGCTLTGLPESMVPAAVLIEWSATPLTVLAAWGLDETAGSLVELAVDPAWTCVPMGD